MTDPTLAEFLLARIAEDADTAADAFNEEEEYRAEMDAYGSERRDLVIPGAAGDHYHRWDPARVLAECEAKRRIVERHQKVAAEQWESKSRRETRTLRWVMMLLTVPYADHPDYRDEWRV